MTKPSSSMVTGIIGEVKDDYAINVYLAEHGKNFWFSHDLLEFVDHGAGAEARVGSADYKFVRTESGHWDKVPISEEPKELSDDSKSADAKD